MQKLDLGLLVLRIVFGLTMMSHGWNKFFSPSGIDGTTRWFAAIGMKWPSLQSRIAASSEIGSGMLLTVGLFNVVSTTMFVALMIVAIITVHARVGFFIFLPNGGWEYCAAIIATATALSLTGPGQYSLDNALGIPSSWSVVALPLGIILALCHVAISYRPDSQGSAS